MECICSKEPSEKMIHLLEVVEEVLGKGVRLIVNVKHPNKNQFVDPFQGIAVSNPTTLKCTTKLLWHSFPKGGGLVKLVILPDEPIFEQLSFGDLSCVGITVLYCQDSERFDALRREFSYLDSKYFQVSFTEEVITCFPEGEIIYLPATVESPPKGFNTLVGRGQNGCCQHLTVKTGPKVPPVMARQIEVFRCQQRASKVLKSWRESWCESLRE